ncbi:MAG TPA: hypothetical protein VFB13_07615 [Reyranella sp.]|jgi:hypothetical protein|nr:hypothetical protein [Reyranella sp.]
MPLAASLLATASAAIVLAFGLLHLFHTFRGNMLHPREPGVMEAMQQSGLRLTRQTTVWRAWTGFNASHGIALILFGALYGYLALALPGVLFGSIILRAMGLAALLAYVGLSKLYFFRTPLRGVIVATVLYVAGLIAAAF